MKKLQNMGVLISPKDIRDYTIVEAPSVPETFELRMCRVKNQGSYPTCVAHALASVVEYFHKEQEGNYIPFSTNFIYGNRTKDDTKKEGMYVREALKNLLRCGDVYEQDCKGNYFVKDSKKIVSENKEELLKLAYPHRISAYAKVDSEYSIKNALMNYGPVVCSLPWYSNSKTINGILVHSKEQTGYHCVVIYGWNEKGWLIQNSWGRFWGNKGCFILPYSEEIREAWSLIDEVLPNDTNIVKPTLSFYQKFLIKFLNFSTNFLKR